MRCVTYSHIFSNTSSVSLLLTISPVDTSSKSDHPFVMDAIPVPVPVTTATSVTQAATNGAPVLLVPKKRGPGRPRKHPLPPVTPVVVDTQTAGLLMLAPVADSKAGVVVVPNPNSLSRSVRGPRVKTVCRSTATGLPRATFSPKNINVQFQDQETGDDGEEEETRSQRSCDSEDSDAIPVTDYIIMNHKREMREERLAAGLEVDDDDEDEDEEEDDGGEDGTSKENTVSKKKKRSPKERMRKNMSESSNGKKKKRPKSSSPETPVKRKRKKAKISIQDPVTPASAWTSGQDADVISDVPVRKKRGPKPGSKRVKHGSISVTTPTHDKSSSKKNSSHKKSPHKTSFGSKDRPSGGSAGSHSIAAHTPKKVCFFLMPTSLLYSLTMSMV